MEVSRAIRSSKRSRYRNLRWFFRGPSCPKVTLKARVSTILAIKGIVTSSTLSGVSSRLIIFIVIDIKFSVG